MPFSGVEDEPATNINAARLRAKYYGACYIIHRPFLKYALDHELFSDKPFFRDNGPRYWLRERRDIEFLQDMYHGRNKTTTVFDRVMEKGRLIVTNIFGTAHAYVIALPYPSLWSLFHEHSLWLLSRQFGNMLVLFAIYKSISNVLSSLISQEELEKLYDRTIAFLWTLARLSESLHRDLQISSVKGTSSSTIGRDWRLPFHPRKADETFTSHQGQHHTSLLPDVPYQELQIEFVTCIYCGGDILLLSAASDTGTFVGFGCTLKSSIPFSLPCWSMPTALASVQRTHIYTCTRT